MCAISHRQKHQNYHEKNFLFQKRRFANGGSIKYVIAYEMKSSEMKSLTLQFHRL